MALFSLPETDNVEQFDIEFDSPTAVVYAGQHLKGQVTVKLGELSSIRSVKLRIIGRSRTSWPDDRFYQLPIKDHSVMCQAEQVFIDTTVTIFGQTNGRIDDRKSKTRREALREGIYEFPFEIEIDIDCPSTFEGENGYIRYICFATIGSPWKNDRTAKRAFTVVQPCDLNYYILPNSNRAAYEPVDNEATIFPPTHCCLLRNGNEITMLVRLPKSGYVCGECIPIWANISNKSALKIRTVKATLLQRVRYKSKFRGNMTRERVCYRTLGQAWTKEELGAHWALVWDKANILIPTVVPTTLEDSCSLIRVDYAIVYEAASICLALPIHIGTVPVKSSAKSLGQCYKSDLCSMNPSRYPKQLLPVHPNWTKYLSVVPPPCYCKDDNSGPVSIRERADMEYVPGQLLYEPRYPFYGWPPSDYLTDADDNLSVSTYQ